jgi:hypothetical protein
MRAPGGARGADYARRHVLVGWWSLLFFATMGIVLESLHGFKVRAYLDVSSETRRLMWTLAHAYGTLLALIQIVFGLMLRSSSEVGASDLRLLSLSLMGASVLVPGGFLLGGLGADGDPGLGVLLVPIGGSLLVWALFWIARATATGVPSSSS